MAKEEGKITVEGTVIEALPATQFRVRLDNDHLVLAYLSGNIRDFGLFIQYYSSILVQVLKPLAYLAHIQRGSQKPSLNNNLNHPTILILKSL